VHIDFLGRLTDEPEIRAGLIGCGSHTFRNVIPTFQFAPVHLAACCDLQVEKARAFAEKFGAAGHYADYKEMIAKEDLDAVFIVLPPAKRGGPLYPDIAAECLSAGVHVWTEKPPAMTCEEVERIHKAEKDSGKIYACGLKKMFMPANEKAKELISSPEFGNPSLIMLRYPQYIPTTEELTTFLTRESVHGCVGFLDHLCHPLSLLVMLAGMPSTLFYERAANGAGIATFTYASGAVASIALTAGDSLNGGMERTVIVSDRGRHVTVENNIRVTLWRNPNVGYGDNPDFYRGGPEEAGAVWEPEFSLGQLYNKGLFLLGYYGEVNEFAKAVLEGRQPTKGGGGDAWAVTRIFEAFAEGPGKTIELGSAGW